jgi:hypothetical protein
MTAGGAAAGRLQGFLAGAGILARLVAKRTDRAGQMMQGAPNCKQRS